MSKHQWQHSSNRHNSFICWGRFSHRCFVTQHYCSIISRESSRKSYLSLAWAALYVALNNFKKLLYLTIQCSVMALSPQPAFLENWLINDTQNWLPLVQEADQCAKQRLAWNTDECQDSAVAFTCTKDRSMISFPFACHNDLNNFRQGHWHSQARHAT